MSQDLLKNQENKTEESPYPFAKTQAKLQPKTVSRLQPKLFDLKKSNNTSNSQMPEEVQAKMENSFGQDFSNVNIHANSSQAEDLGAKAYAQGSDIHFAPGQYDPNSKSGQELLGHELTHVVQQSQGKVGQGEVHGKGLEINTNASLEKEADEMGKLASEGKNAMVQDRQLVGLQMKPDDKQITTEDNIQTRFKEFKITKTDLTDAYVIEEFNKMSYTQLFDYQEKSTDADVKSHIIELVKAKPKDPNKSYEGKTFTINDSNAVVRNDDFTEKKYKEGDSIPEGKKAGDSIVIPKDTLVFISEYKYINSAKRYVKVVDYGWTSAGNIQGGFYNETVGLTKAKWDSQDPTHKTIGDPNAVIRELDGLTYEELSPQQAIPKGKEVSIQKTSSDKKFVFLNDTESHELGWTIASHVKTEKNITKITLDKTFVFTEIPNYKTTAKVIPQGSYVVVKEESLDTEPKGKYVKVSSVKKDNEQYTEDANLGWTSSSNLVEGWAKYKGESAEWEKGSYIGQTDVVKITGTLGQLETIASETLTHYNTLREAAAADGIELKIQDAYRDFAKQQSEWDKNPDPNKVAVPGRSNHQHGQAIDLNTGGFGTTIYKWLQTHGPALGWIRTVNNEDWHWEYRPDDAKKHGYKMPGIY